MLEWIPTPYRRNKDETYADVDRLGRLYIKRRKGGFRVYQDREPIGPVYAAVEGARATASRFAELWGK